MVQVLYWILGGIAGGVLYRMGGSGNYARQHRVVTIPVVLSAVAYILTRDWRVVFGVPVMIGAISTYWDFLVVNKGVDNMWMHGFGVGLAGFAVALASGQWGMWVVRSLWLAITCGLLNVLLKHRQKQSVLLWRKDVFEEFVRGFLIVQSMGMVLDCPRCVS